MTIFKKFIYQTILLGSILSFAFGINYLEAWTGPTATAPNNNVAAPLNIGTTAQVKDGNVSVGASANSATTLGLTVFGAQYVKGWLKVGNTGTPTQLLELSGSAGVDGIKFPDGTVQTSAAGSSVASAVGGGGLLPQNSETNIGSNWSVVYLFEAGEISGGDAKSGLSTVYKEGGVIKAVLGAPNKNTKLVDPVTTTKVCSGASAGTNDICVRLVGTDLLVQVGSDSKGIYTTLK